MHFNLFLENNGEKGQKGKELLLWTKTRTIITASAHEVSRKLKVLTHAHKYPPRHQPRKEPQLYRVAYLTKWMFPSLSPSVMGLICTHSYLSVFGTSHWSLVDIGRSKYYVLVIYYHTLGMNINHKPLIFICIGDLKENFIIKANIWKVLADNKLKQISNEFKDLSLSGHLILCEAWDELMVNLRKTRKHGRNTKVNAFNL